MRRLALLILVLAGVGCGKHKASPTTIDDVPEGPVQHSPTPPFTFGYYWMAADQPAGGVNGDFLDEMPSYVNMGYVGIVTWPLERVREFAQRAKRRNIWIVYSVVDVMQFSKNPEAVWAEQLPKIREFDKLGILHSVYIFDEPFNYGISDSFQMRVAGLVKAAGFRTMLVQERAAAGKHIPVDYFGITCYYHIGIPGGNGGCRNDYYNSDANILVMPGFYSGDGRRCTGCLARWDQLAWGDLARELKHQGRLQGVMPFLWPSFNQYTGTRDDREFQQQHRQIVEQYLR